MDFLDLFRDLLVYGAKTVEKIFPGRDMNIRRPGQHPVEIERERPESRGESVMTIFISSAALFSTSLFFYLSDNILSAILVVLMIMFPVTCKTLVEEPVGIINGQWSFA